MYRRKVTAKTKNDMLKLVAKYTKFTFSVCFS